MAKLDATGSTLAYSTFLGGTGSDSGLGIAVDEKGKAAHVTGSTASADFPTTGRAFDVSYNGGGDAFVTKFDRAGSSLAYSTFLGGTAAIRPRDRGRREGQGRPCHRVDRLGRLPDHRRRVRRQLQRRRRRVRDQVRPCGLGARLLDVPGRDGDDAGLGIAVDEKGRAAFLTGSTASSDYPTSTDANDPSYSGTGDGILTKLALRRGDGAAAGR